jgi:hypothetical protein
MTISEALMKEKRKAFLRADPKAYRRALLEKARRIKAEKQALREAFPSQFRRRRK